MVHELGHVLGLGDYAPLDSDPTNNCDHFRKRLVDPLGDHLSVMTYPGDTPECRTRGVITGRDLRDFYEAYHVGPLTGVRMDGDVKLSQSGVLSATFHWGKDGAEELSHNATHIIAQRKTTDGWRTLRSIPAIRGNGMQQSMIKIVDCGGLATEYRLVGSSAFKLGLSAFLENDALVPQLARRSPYWTTSCTPRDPLGTTAEHPIGDPTYVVGVAGWDEPDDKGWCRGAKCPAVLSASVSTAYCHTGQFFAINPTDSSTPRAKLSFTASGGAKAPSITPTTQACGAVGGRTKQVTASATWDTSTTRTISIGYYVIARPKPVKFDIAPTAAPGTCSPGDAVSIGWKLASDSGGPVTVHAHGQSSATSPFEVNCPPGVTAGSSVEVWALRKDGGGRQVTATATQPLRLTGLGSPRDCVSGEDEITYFQISGGSSPFADHNGKPYTVRGPSDTWAFDYRCPSDFGPSELTISVTDGVGRTATAPLKLNVTCALPLSAPPVPYNQAGGIGSGAISLTWSEVCAESYRVRFAPADLDGNAARDTDQPPVTVDRLQPNTVYRFTVQALAQGESSPESVAANLKTAPPPPQAAVTFDAWEGATGGPYSVVVRWPQVAGASAYEAELVDISPGNPLNAAVIAAGADEDCAAAKDTRARRFCDLAAAGVYEIAVEARNSDGATSDSGHAIACLGPCAPGVSSVSTTGLRMDWTALDPDVAIHHVRVRLGEQVLANGYGSHRTHQTLSQLKLAGETTYTAEVRLYSVTRRAYTLWAGVEFTTPEAPPPEPLALTVTPSTTTCLTGEEIRLSWTVTGGSGSYRVRVAGTEQTGSSTQLSCQQTPGAQSVAVAATDATHSELSATTQVPLTVIADTVEATIRAQRLSDGRVEFALRLADGTEITPSTRYATPTQMTDGGWDESERLSAALGGKSYPLGKVSVRLDHTVCPAALQFTFLPEHGERTTPAPHRLPVNSAVDTWLGTGTFAIALRLSAVQASPSGSANQLMAQSSRATDCAAAPAGLRTSELTSSSVSLSWDEVTGATQYDARLDGGKATELSATARSHKFTGLDPATAYQLEVRARHAGGASMWSSATVTTEAAPVPPPAGLRVTPAVSSLRLTWQAVGGATGYGVRLDGGAETTLAATTTSREFTGLEANTKYTLGVRAYIGSDVSAWAAVEGTTSPSPLVLTATATPMSCETNGQVSIGWTVTGGSGSYTVSVNGVAQSGASVRLTCQSTAGAQRVTVSAADRTFSQLTATQTLRLTVTTSTSVRAQIRARRLSDDRVEFRLRLTDGTELTTAKRFLKLPDAAHGRWIASGEHQLRLEGTDYALGVVSARLDTTSCPAQVEVTFVPTAGERIKPTRHKLKVDREVNVWARTSEFKITLVAAADRALSGQTGASDEMDATADQTGAGPGREGGLMSGDGTDAVHAAQARDAEVICTAQPTGLKTSHITSSGVRLAWNKVSAASQYDAAVGDGPPQTLDATQLHYDFSGLAADNAYTLKLRARSWRGASTWSAISARTKTASQPSVTISAGSSPITEGAVASFTVTSDRSLTTNLSVGVSVTETGAVIAGTAPGGVIIASGQRTATVRVATTNDAQDESNSVVTAQLTAGSGYRLGSATSASVTVHDNDDPPPPPVLSCTSAKPASTRQLQSTETGAETHTNTRATRPKTRTLTQPQTRTVECKNGQWITGEWANSGTASEGSWRYGSWSCIAKPDQPDPDDGSRTVSTTTAWEVSGSTATQVRTVVTQPRQRTYSWSAAPVCLWQAGAWGDVGSAQTTRTTLQTKVKPTLVTYRVDSSHVRTGRTRVIRVQTTPVCLEQSQAQYAYTRTIRVRDHVWRAPNWTPTDRAITPPIRYTYWANVGGQRLCALRAVRGEEEQAAARQPALREEFAAGSHELQWGADRLSFTVPAGAQVRVESRVLASGEVAAAFVAASGAELVVTAALVGAGGLTSTDPLLALLAPTLTLAAAPALPALPEEAPTCAVLQVADGARVDLDEVTCAQTAGQSVSVSLAGATLTLRLTANREWLLMAGPAPDGAEAMAIWLTDLATGSLLALDPSKGSELGRVTAHGAAEVGALFDAIAGAEPP